MVSKALMFTAFVSDATALRLPRTASDRNDVRKKLLIFISG